MKKKDFLKLIEDLNDEEELKFYVWDCEYGEDEYEIGKGKIRDYDGYVNIRVYS